MIFRAIVVVFSLLISDAYADARLIVHLTDYLANDYAGAVSEEGKVLSDGEYAEQVEFSQTALKEGTSDSAISSNEDLVRKLKQLNDLIAKKSSPSKVIPLAREIQQLTITVSGMALSPSSWPNLERGKELYVQNCIQCHGQDGKGDGPEGVDLDPKPANFHDMERAPIVSPFAAFNTIRLGVPGTGMLSYSNFPDEDIWALAFYVSSFRYGIPVKTREILSQKVSNDELLTKAASQNDEQLELFLLGKGEKAELVKAVRVYHFDGQSNDHLGKAEVLLQEAVSHSQKGDQKAAERSSLEAYFVGIEPVENKLAANDPALVTRIEEKMAAFRLAIKASDHENIVALQQELSREIQNIRSLLSDEQMTPGIAFLSGFSIILREGFEAVLVIIAILGVGAASGSALVTAAIHSGWIVSLVLGVIGWFVSGILLGMSGVSREIMEAGAAFFAVFVLLYVGFWMHRQTEISRWKEFIEVKVKNLAQTKNLVGLFILSFVVTFREVIETILFLRTVSLDAAEGTKIYILVGVLFAFTVVMIVSIMMTKFRSKIPLSKFFNLSSVIMLILAVVLASKGVHALIEAGIVQLSPFPLKLRVELLGIYPTWETWITQVVVLIASFVIWKAASKKGQ